VTGDRKDIEKAGTAHGRLLLYDIKGNPMLLFADRWAMRSAVEKESRLQFHESAP
jgi:peptide chain release factor 3